MRAAPDEPTILYEDDDLIAVHKPSGLSSIPGRDDRQRNLLALLSARLADRPYVVHRLDQAVSGVILFAKNAAAHKCLNDQFAERRIHKTYIALVHGRVKNADGKSAAPIRKFGSGRMGEDPAKGLPSLTHYRVARRLPIHTLLDVHPVTGRRHQIRVHLFGLGHPIVGDDLYGDKRVQAFYPRIFLHAHQIVFTHPAGGQKTIISPLPLSLEQILKHASGQPALQKIVSGGQTGVDRAALAAARELGIPIGGWCPRGRLAEDGVVPAAYPLHETPLARYEQRTEWNVRDSDGTLVVTRSTPTGGTDVTIRCAHKLKKPCLILRTADTSAASLIQNWLWHYDISVLNVAGPRESKSPGIFDEGRKLLLTALSPYAP